jgi:O-antigen/teichoic acid export membrane protein
LSQKVSRGIVWVTIAAFVTRAIGFITAIVLARLLAPADFGLMAIAMTIISFSQGTTWPGLESAIIQKQDKPEEFLNAAWSIELFRCIILAVIIFLSAPLLAIFFTDQLITPILRMLSLSILIGGFRNNGVVFFRKNLQLDKQFILEVVPLIANILIVIPLAFFIRSVWALVLATMATNIIGCAMTYIMHPNRPRFEWDHEKIRDLFSFSKWILGQSIINTVLDQAVTMFIGKLHGISNLGFYNRACAFSSAIFIQMEWMVWKIGYPLLSRLQSAEDRLKKVYLQTAYLLNFIGIPMAGGLFVMSGDFVHLLLTDKWLSIVPLMQILALQSAVSLFVSPSAMIFQAVGRPGIGTKITTLTVILMVLMIYPLSRKWGLQGTVAVLFLSQLIVAPLSLYMGRRISKCTWMELLKPILFSVISTGIMMSMMMIAKLYLFAECDFYRFIGLIFIGIIVYGCITYILDKLFQFGVYSMVGERIVAAR